MILFICGIDTANKNFVYIAQMDGGFMENKRDSWKRRIVAFLSIFSLMMGLLVTPNICMAQEGVVWLSDLIFSGAQTVTGEMPLRDVMPNSTKTVGDYTFEKAVVLMADGTKSSYVHFDLAGAYATFSAVAAVDDASVASTLDFFVYGDGRLLASAFDLEKNRTKSLSASVAGIEDLALVIKGNGNGVFADAAVAPTQTIPDPLNEIALSGLAGTFSHATAFTDATGVDYYVAGSRDTAGLAVRNGLRLEPKNGEAYVLYDCDAFSATRVSALVGHDLEATSQEPLAFEIHADFGSGYQKVAESPRVEFGEHYYLTAELTNADGVKLIAKGADGTVGLFGNAALATSFATTMGLDALLPLSGFSVGAEGETGYAYNQTLTGDALKIGETTYASGVYFKPSVKYRGADRCPVETGLSYDLSGFGATKFVAVAGQSATAQSEDGLTVTVVGDGKVLEKSPVLTGGQTYQFDLDITDITLLTLKADFLSSADGDAAVFGDVAITVNGRYIQDKETETVDLTTVDWVSFKDYHAELTLNQEASSSNFPQYAMKLAGVAMNRMIGLHPRGDGESSVTYNIAGMGYTRFNSFVGKRDSWMAEVGPLYATFAVYGDGVLLYETDRMTYGEVAYLSVDITGVDELRIAVTDGGDGISCDSSGFGNPVLVRELETPSLYVNESFEQMIPGDQVTMTGRAMGIGQLSVLVNGTQADAEITMDCYGAFTVKVGNFAQSINTITLNGMRGDDLLISQSFTVKLAVGDYLDLSDMAFLSTSPKGCTITRNQNFLGYHLQIGDGAVKSNNGIGVNASEGESSADKDIQIDLSDLGQYTYFRATVGRDDFGATDGEVLFNLLADGVSLAKSKIMRLGEVTVLEAQLPAGTQTLTLRTSYLSGWGTVADWIEPRIYTSKEVVDTLSYTGYTAGMEVETYQSQGIFAVQFNTASAFRSLSLMVDAVDTAAEVRLYRYASSIERSMQAQPLYSVDGTAANLQELVVDPAQTLPAGEYLLVVCGGITVKAHASNLSRIYFDGTYTNAMPHLILNLSQPETGDQLLAPSACAQVVQSNEATEQEKARAKSVLDGYLNDLATLPVTLTIGDVTYHGFNGDFAFVDKIEETVGAKTKITVFLKHISGLDFEIRFVWYPDYAAYEWTVYFTNHTETNSPVIKNVLALDMTVEGANPYLDTSYGDTCSNTTIPYMPLQIWLEEGKTYTFKPKEERGRSTENVFPYYNFEAGDNGMLLAIGWPGEWKGDITFDGTATTFKAGQQYFESYLEPGETARTPLAAFVLYDGRDMDRATNLWRRWYIDCNMPTTDGEKIEGYIAGGTAQQTNEMITATEDNQIDAIRSYIASGVQLDYWWMDAGWYVLGEEHDGVTSWALTGSWVVDTERFPTEFAGVTAYAKENDMKTMLWFEPERVGFSLNNIKDDGTTIKKEWLIGYGTDKWDTAGPHYMLDLGNDECRAWLVERVMSVLDTGGISMYREDFNIYAQQYWTLGDSEKRIGITENKSVQGHLAYWDTLLTINPELIIDSCASGGGRNDLENLRRAIVLHPTDALYFDEEAKQAGSMLMYRWWPYVGTNTGQMTHDSINLYQLRSSYRPWTAYFLNPGSVSNNSDVLAQGVNEHNAIRDLYYGDYYMLTEWSVSQYKWLSYQFMDRNNANGFVLAYRRQRGEETKHLRLKGLKGSHTYRVTNLDTGEETVATGKQLMTVGVTVSLDTLDSALLMIENMMPQLDNCDSANGWTASNQATTVVTDTTVAKDGASIVFSSPAAGFKANNHYLATVSKTLDTPMDLSGFNTLTVDMYAAKSVNSGVLSVDLTGVAHYRATGNKTDQYTVTFPCNFEKGKWYQLEIDLSQMPDRTDIQFITFSWIDETKTIGSVVNDSLDLRLERISVWEETPQFQPNDIRLGDVDANGIVNATDALLVLKATVNIITLSDEATVAADVDGNKILSAVDALNILKFTVNKIQKFPIQSNM